MAFYEDLPVGTLRAERIYLDGTEMTSSAAELSYLDITAAGTVQASKAVVVDANKDAGDFRNLDAVNIDAGASGTAGSVDIFPATASKGKIAITAADSAGDTTTTIVNASQAGARTYTIPDAGASASFVMTEGAQTVNGVKTFGSGIAFGAGATLEADSGTVTETGGAATLNKMAGVVTSEALTTAAAASYTLTLTNTVVAATDLVFVSVQNGTNTQGIPLVSTVTPGSESVVIVINNQHATDAFNGTIKISFLVVKA
jgi:hypothetical protein